MTIAVTLHTYQRADGTTPFYLKRALESIGKQTYKDIFLFIIGDKYENNNEFVEIINWFKKTYPEFSSKVFYKNLDYAKERDKYLKNNLVALWNCGGANALNYAIDQAISMGFYRMCHLDHDDYWESNHIEVVVKAVTENYFPPFMHTLSSYVSNEVFPMAELNNEVKEHYPFYANLIHSSVYIDFSKIDFRYRDLWEEEQRYFPSDGDMWERIRLYCLREGLKCYIINTRTCHHDLENH